MPLRAHNPFHEQLTPLNESERVLTPTAGQVMWQTGGMKLQIGATSPVIKQKSMYKR